MLNCPVEIIPIICSFLDMPDLVRFGRTCSKFHQLTKIVIDKANWQDLFKRVWPTSYSLTPNHSSNWKANYIRYYETQRLFKQKLLITDLPLYQQKCLVADDGHSFFSLVYHKGETGQVHHLRHHTQIQQTSPKFKILDRSGKQLVDYFKIQNSENYQLNMVQLAVITNDFIAMGLKNGEIHAFQWSGHLINSLIGHKGKIVALKSQNQSIYIGNEDGSLKVWDIQYSTIKIELKKHQASITCMQLLGPERIATGSEDQSICFWNLLESKVKVQKSHKSSISCLKTLGSFLLSADHNGVMHIRDYPYTKIVKVIQIQGNEEEKQISDVYWDSSKLISISTKGNLRFWDFDQGTCLININLAFNAKLLYPKIYVNKDNKIILFSESQIRVIEVKPESKSILSKVNKLWIYFMPTVR